MTWHRPKRKSSENELGEYLPDPEAQPYEQSEPIRAYNKQMQKKSAMR